MALRTVVILGFDGVQPLDLVGPHEVFTAATKVLHAVGREDDGYRVSVVSLHGGPLVGESGLRLHADAIPPTRSIIDTLLLPGGDGVHDARRDAATVAWVRSAASRSRRVATVCTGTFLAAEAGLLTDRSVTTHWARAQRLASEFPDVHVDADPIYLRDGNVWTSAGVTAGIDLSLALVDDDYGGAVAQQVARWLVMYLHRPGGQTQFATPVWTDRAERSVVRRVQESIEAEPAADHSVAALARRASMSARHLTRLFIDEIGESPARYVERVRVEAARRRLETTSDGLDAVATACGFGTTETLRRAFHRRLAVAPDAYRRRFHVA